MCREQSCRGTLDGQGSRESRQRASAEMLQLARQRRGWGGLGGVLSFRSNQQNYDDNAGPHATSVGGQPCQVPVLCALTDERRTRGRARKIAAPPARVRGQDRDTPRGSHGRSRHGMVRTRQVARDGAARDYSAKCHACRDMRSHHIRRGCALGGAARPVPALARGVAQPVATRSARTLPGSHRYGNYHASRSSRLLTL